MRVHYRHMSKGMSKLLGPLRVDSIYLHRAVSPVTVVHELSGAQEFPFRTNDNGRYVANGPKREVFRLKGRL